MVFQEVTYSGEHERVCKSLPTKTCCIQAQEPLLLIIRGHYESATESQWPGFFLISRSPSTYLSRRGCCKNTTPAMIENKEVEAPTEAKEFPGSPLGVTRRRPDAAPT